MLFAKRDLKDARGVSLSQRFAHRIGRYLTASNDDQISSPTPIDRAACYALLGESSHNTESHELDNLRRTIQRIVKNYHTKTGRWLNHEQVAFATTWHDAKQQATILKERFRHLNIPLATLEHNSISSPLHLSLLSEALQITQFSIYKHHLESAQPCTCSRTLNIPLDETNLAELENIGREVRENCEQSILERGTSLDDTEACWRLTLHYEGCDKTLALKCMPIEMLREVFETQYLQEYGSSNENQTIIIEKLDIEIRLTDATPTSDTVKNSFYAEQWLSQWQPFDAGQSTLWSKQHNPVIQEKFSWLQCPILEDILTKRVINQPNSSMPDFFLKNYQKDVDEVVMRN